MKIDDKYKWLARDRDGELRAYEYKPSKEEINDIWGDEKTSFTIKEVDERFSFIRWENELPTKISDIANILAIDSNDVVSKPSHYIGINGLEVEQILAEFLPKIEDSYVAHRIGSAIEYLLRSSSKNGDEDIKKAGQNIEQIIKYKQGKQA